MINLRNKFKKARGFTLLEILVVISIIGILIAIGSAAFTTAQKKGRDARRRADMKQYQSAFEQYFSENNTYSSCVAMESSFVGGAPSDPKPGGTAYDCTVSAGNAGYCVCATLDFDTTGNANGGAAGACNFAAGGTDFCVQNLQ